MGEKEDVVQVAEGILWTAGKPTDSNAGIRW